MGLIAHPTTQVVLSFAIVTAKGSFSKIRFNAPSSICYFRIARE